MTKRHYFTSLGILLASLFYVKTVLELHWWEAFGLVILAVACVVHSIDVMRDVDRRKKERQRHIQEPPSDPDVKT